VTTRVIKGGTVVDGSGGPAYRADVAIEGDRIVDVAKGLAGDVEIDAGDCIVAPGFIDIHTHFDAQVFWDPALTPSCFHGVTTVVAGNCGFSIAPVRQEHHELVARTLENVEDMSFAALMSGVPWDFSSFADYLGAVRRRRPLLNFSCYVGHSAVRMAVLGDDAYERTATAEEVAVMRQVVRQAMEAGAAGFSSSYVPVHLGAEGKPVPSRFAESSEFEALAAVLTDLDRGVVQISGSAFPEGMYDFQRRNGRPLTTPMLAGPTTQAALARHRAERTTGSNLWPQVTPRPLVMGLSATQPYLLNSITPVGALLGSSPADRVRAYSDPSWRQSVRDSVKDTQLIVNWDKCWIAESATHKELVGRPLSDVAVERGCLPIDVLLDAAVDDGLDTTFQVVVANDDPDSVAELLTSEGVTLGLSDAGAHVSQLCDAPQGTDLLANWVRDRGIVEMEQAIRMLSGLQADLFGFRDRGYLRPGGFADITIFDPATIAPGPIRRVQDLPGGGSRLTADQPEGVAHVLVNGVPVVESGAIVCEAGMGHVFGPESY